MIDAILGLEAQLQRAVIAGLLIALALAVVGGGAGILYYRAEAAEAREEATRCAGDLAVSQANVETLNGAVDRQNKAVGALQTEGDKRVAESEAARKRAEAEAAKQRARAGDILAAKPVNPDALCDSALALYRERAGR